MEKSRWRKQGRQSLIKVISQDFVQECQFSCLFCRQSMRSHPYVIVWRKLYSLHGRFWIFIWWDVRVLALFIHRQCLRNLYLKTKHSSIIVCYSQVSVEHIYREGSLVSVIAHNYVYIWLIVRSPSYKVPLPMLFLISRLYLCASFMSLPNCGAWNKERL